MIGYYIHHHGHGHLARANAVATASNESIVALSSLPPPSAHNFAGWVTLAPDSAINDPDDRRAGGALHWAPLNSPGYRQRMAQAAEWVARSRPRLVVVDVSVEVTALFRLLGVPVVVVAGPGNRDDAAHELAHRMADRIIAPWPRDILEPAFLAPFADKTDYVGAFSRFDGFIPDDTEQRGHVLVLLGSGGTQLTSAAIESAQRASETWTWRAVGGADLPWTGDVWSELQRADVVITHAGMSALAEVAAARRPAVVVPQPRPFAEQHATAAALGAAGVAVTLDTWPHPTHWDAILSEARARGGRSWARWNDGRGAERFVRSLSGTRVGSSSHVA